MADVKRYLTMTSVLGDGVLALTSFSGSEAISQLFHFHLEMISDNEGIAAKSIVGTPITWTVLETDGPRSFNGVVNRLIAGPAYKGGKRTYWADVVPELWFLTRTANCQIYQNMSAKDIILDVLGKFSIKIDSSKLTGTYAEREYCVQYRETAFNFISRLMEYEGIFYYFVHADGAHTMVLGDALSAFQNCLDSTVIYGSGGSSAYHHVHTWEHQYEYRSGKITQADHNFETPSNPLLVNESTVLQLKNIASYELFDYPGGYMVKDNGSSEVKIRMEEEETAYESIAAGSTVETFFPGGKFKLKEHDIASEEGGFVITSIQHQARDSSYEKDTSGSGYQNTFICIPDSVTYRPPRVTPTPIVHGSQTAVVVGKSGEEIWCDKYGRVKVQFFWDRLGNNDENSSCWVRAAHHWAGKGWGAIFTPRIGQEVVVDFLEGDPDRPLIVGRVYNADQMPPYDLPANQTISTIKGDSSKGHSSHGGNELCFEDKKSSELVTLHAEKDQAIKVEHDESHWVGHDRTKTIDHDETTEVKHDRTETVDNDESITIKGNRTEEVDKDESITIKGNRTEEVDKDESITIKGNRTEEVDKDESITIKGQRTENVTKDESITISGGRTVKVTKDENITISGGQTISVGKALSITATDKITLTTGQSSITMTNDGTITIKGMSISIQGTQSVEIKGMNIKSTADIGNKMAGVMVNLEADGINTIKGALVKVN